MSKSPVVNRSSFVALCPSVFFCGHFCCACELWRVRPFEPMTPILLLSCQWGALTKPQTWSEREVELYRSWNWLWRIFYHWHFMSNNSITWCLTWKSDILRHLIVWSCRELSHSPWNQYLSQIGLCLFSLRHQTLKRCLHAECLVDSNIYFDSYNLDTTFLTIFQFISN